MRIADYDDVPERRPTGRRFDLTAWLADAPEPDEVLAHAGSLLAHGLHFLDDDDLRLADHVHRVRTILADDAYDTFYAWCGLGHVPLLAVPVMDLHKRFARQVMRIRITDEGRLESPDELPMDQLYGLAARCCRERGRLCRACRRPACLHVEPCPTPGSSPEQ